jgi:hypothetical protein
MLLLAPLMRFKEKNITEMLTIINITFRHCQIMMKNIFVLFQSWSRVSDSKKVDSAGPYRARFKLVTKYGFDYRLKKIAGH